MSAKARKLLDTLVQGQNPHFPVRVLGSDGSDLGRAIGPLATSCGLRPMLDDEVRRRDEVEDAAAVDQLTRSALAALERAKLSRATDLLGLIRVCPGWSKGEQGWVTVMALADEESWALGGGRGRGLVSVVPLSLHGGGHLV